MYPNVYYRHIWQSHGVSAEESVRHLPHFLRSVWLKQPWLPVPEQSFDPRPRKWPLIREFVSRSFPWPGTHSGTFWNIVLNNMFLGKLMETFSDILGHSLGPFSDVVRGIIAFPSTNQPEPLGSSTAPEACRCRPAPLVQHLRTIHSFVRSQTHPPGVGSVGSV